MKKILSLAFVVLFITGCVTSEDLDKAYQKGFDEGYQEGVEDGEIESEKNNISWEEKKFILDQNDICLDYGEKIKEEKLPRFQILQDRDLTTAFYSPKLNDCVHVEEIRSTSTISKYLYSKSEPESFIDNCSVRSYNCMDEDISERDKELCSYVKEDGCYKFEIRVKELR